jgi:hypothetical protein
MKKRRVKMILFLPISLKSRDYLFSFDQNASSEKAGIDLGFQKILQQIIEGLLYESHL